MKADVIWLALNVAAVTITGACLLAPESEMPRIVTVALFGLNCAYTPFFFRQALRPNVI